MITVAAIVVFLFLLCTVPMVAILGMLGLWIGGTFGAVIGVIVGFFCHA
jgi:hypothetical protein